MNAAADPSGLLQALAAAEVDYVVIGGFAAIAHGARRVTRDLDIAVLPSSENLSRLEDALATMEALALEAGGGSRPISGSDLAEIALGATLHTVTSAGALDIVGRPAGAPEYAALRARSIELVALGVKLRVAGRDDLVAMKRAAGRPLDLQDIADITAPAGQ